MKIRIESLYACSPKWLFEEIRKTESFFFVTHPVMKFVPKRELTDIWENGRYKMKMYLFGIIPMGNHDIVIELEEENCKMRDNGNGDFIDKWNHLISVKPHGKYTKYIDEVEIEAGYFTFVITAFAQVFYCYRQFRWKKWIQKRNNRF